MRIPKILIVDDEEDIEKSLTKLISRRFICDIDRAMNGWETLEKLKKDNFDLIILDLKMPGLNGIDVIKETIKFTPETKILVVSSYDSHEIAAEALKAGATDFIHKPQTIEAIELKIKNILTRIGKYEMKKF